MSSREDHKKETVRRILDAAAQEFADTGYEGARVDHIADCAGVNKAMIYYHIGDKKALYTRVLHEVFGDTTAILENSIRSAVIPVEKIRAYIHSIGQTIIKNPLLPRIMMRELASGGRHLPKIVAHDLAEIISLIGNAITRGHREGAFKKIDPLVLHMMVIGGIGYYRASEGIRRDFASLMDERIETKRDADASDLINEVEKIVLSALSGYE